MTEMRTTKLLFLNLLSIRFRMGRWCAYTLSMVIVPSFSSIRDLLASKLKMRFIA
jgi:hypothetical protein